MSIWKKETNQEAYAKINKNTVVELLDIEVTEVGDDYLVAKMPVDGRHHQPMGLLHGGVSVVLAESVGSIASNLALDNDHYAVGLEVNANHLRSVRSGYVYATARAVHLGKTTHVWSIEIVNEEGKKTCISRLTMAVLKRDK